MQIRLSRIGDEKYCFVITLNDKRTVDIIPVTRKWIEGMSQHNEIRKLYNKIECEEQDIFCNFELNTRKTEETGSYWIDIYFQDYKKYKKTTQLFSHWCIEMAQDLATELEGIGSEEDWY